MTTEAQREAAFQQYLKNAARPGLRKNQPAVDPSQGGTGRPPGKRAPSWGNLLTP